MGTLASNRKGYIVGAQGASYEEALTATTGTAADSQTGNVNAAMQYFFSTGRGNVFRFTRTFLHFDTSGISGGSSFQLQLTSTAGNSGDSNHRVVAVRHTAGESTGGELANADFDNIDRNTTYSSATGYGSSGTQTISLNAAAATAITGTSHFNVALILEHDLNQEEESPLEESGNISNGIAFGSAINLTYTDPASGYTHKVNAVAAASIGKVNTVATANIGKINTVD